MTLTEEIAQSFEIIDKNELDATKIDDESNNNIITLVAELTNTEPSQVNVTTPTDNDDNNNQSGNRKYTRDELIKLKLAAVNEAPQLTESVKSFIYKESSALDRTLDRTRRGDAVDKMMPAYANLTSRNSYQKQRSNESGRRSAQGNRSQSSSLIKLSLQSNEDVKLNEAKDAWKPQVLVASTDLPEEDRTVLEVLKQFRSVLNKITPENFATLIQQMKQLKLDTVEILDSCISLVFEKAILEPSYGASYAQLCKEVSDVFVVPLDVNNSQQQAVFKKRLITQCQREFEKHRDNELVKNNTERLKEIEDEEDAAKKEELKADYESESFKIRQRAVGTVHFIGELYKIEMLTSKIMVSCISHLLDPTMCSEETLECLCKLLTTIGKRLEKLDTKKVDLKETFVKLEGLVDKKNHLKISSRIRFMIQDLIELRLNNWTPRKLQQVNKPQTMEEIKHQVVMEQYISKMDIKDSSQREDRNNRSGFYTGGNVNNNKRGNMVTEDGWSTQYSKSRPLKLDMNKLQLRPTDEIPTVLGAVPSFQNFGNRFSGLKEEEPVEDQTNRPYNGRFSGGGMNQNRNSFGGPNNNNSNNRGNRGNMNNNSNNRSAGSRSLQPPMHQNNKPQQFGPSRKLSQQPMHLQRPQDFPMKSNQMSRKISVPARPQEFSRAPDRNLIMNVDQVTEFMKKMVKAYQNEEITLNEAIEKLRVFRISKQALVNVYNWVFDQHDKERFLISEIVCEGNIRQMIMTEELLEALQETFELAQDLACDLPKIYCYLGQLLALPLLKGIVQFKDLLKMSKLEIEANNGETVLKNVFKVFEQKFEKEGLSQLFNSAGIDFQLFLDSDRKFIDFLSENVSC